MHRRISRKVTVLFIFLLLFQTVSSGVVLPAQMSAEGNDNIIDGISILNKEGKSVNVEDIEAGEAVDIQVKWSIPETDVETGGFDTQLIPDGVHIRESQTGTLMTGNLEVGNYEAKTDGTITVTIAENVEGSKAANGTFSIDGEIAIKETGNEEDSKEAPVTTVEPDAEEITGDAGEDDEGENTPEKETVATFAAVEENLNLITNFELSYTTADGKSVSIEDGSEIEVDLNDMNAVNLKYQLKKPENLEITDGDTYTIPLPAIAYGITVNNMPITINGDTIGTYSIIDNQIVITFNESVNNYDNVEMNVNISGSFNTEVLETEEEVVIEVPYTDGDSFTTTIRAKQQEYDGMDKKEAGSPYILDENGEKVSVDRNPELIDWTVRANDSMNSYENAIIIDDLGDNLEIVEDSFVVHQIIRNYKNEEIDRIPVDVDPTITESGFELNLGSIDDAYDITYTTQVIRPNGGGTHTINNNARIILGEDENQVNDSFKGTWSGDIPTITKDGSVSEDREDIINWTVEYNFGKESLGEVTLTDSLTHGKVDLESVVVLQVNTDIDGNIVGEGTPIDVKPVQTESSMTLPALDADGKAYLITFSSSVPVGLHDTVVNTISDDLPNPNADDASVPVNTIPTGGKVGEQYVDENGNPYIEWTITMNSEKIDVGSIHITDVFDPTYLEFDVEDKGLYTLNRDGEEVNNFDIDYYEHKDDRRTGFTLNITDAGPHTYEFVYRTYYTVEGMQQPELANHAELIFKDGEGVGIGDPININFDLEGPNAGIEKSGKYITTEDNTEQQIEWTVTFNKSKILLDAGTTLTDDFTSGNYTYIDDSIEVTTTDGSKFNYTFTENNDDSGFLIELNEATNATITVKYKTTTDDVNQQNEAHKNEATLKWQGGEEKDDAVVGVRHPGINKSGEVEINPDGSKTVNWTIDFNTNENVIHKFELIDTYTPTSVDISNIKIMGNDEDVTDDFDITPAMEDMDGEFKVSKEKLDAVSYQLTYSTTLSPAEEQEEIANTADITYTGGNDSAEDTISRPSLIVEKQANRIVKDSSNPVISWTIQANKDSENHYVNLVDAVLEDTIPEDQRLIASSIQIEREDGGNVGLDLIEANDNSFKIALPDGPYQYKVTFETEILQMPSLDDKVFDRYNNSTTLTNQTKNVDLKQEDSDDAWIRYYDGNENNLTVKTGEQNTNTEDIDYSVTINPEGLTIHNAKITDTLSDNHQYIEDSIKLIDANGEELETGFTLTVAENKRSFEIVFKEDVKDEDDLGTIDSSYQITYSTRLNADLIGTYDVENNIVLTGGIEGTELDRNEIKTSSQQWFYGGGGSGRTVKLQINKQNDQGVEQVPIERAVFKLERVDLNSTEPVLVDAEIETNEEGIFVKGDIRAGRYILTETDTPEAYQLLKNPIYFLIGYTDPSAGSNSPYTVTITDSGWNAGNHSHASAEGNEITITNDVATGKVTAKKIWGQLPERGNLSVQPGIDFLISPWGPHALHTQQKSDLGVYFKLYRNVPGGEIEKVPNVDLMRVNGIFNEEMVTWDDVELYTPNGSRYEFSVQEVDENGNDYTPEGYVKMEDGNTVYNLEVNPEITANKNLTGRDLRNGEFEFVLRDVNKDNVTTATNNASGNVKFSNFLKLTEEQTTDLINRSPVNLTYYLSEMPSELGGVTYDDTEYQIDVILQVGQSGKLDIRYDYPDGYPNFSNHYEPRPTKEVRLEANKVLEGLTLREGQFEFELLDANNKVLDTKSNNGDGAVSFGPITYDTDGTYNYKIREAQGDMGGVTYDSSVFNVQVVVTDDTNGNLVADVHYLDGPATFINHYVPDPDTVVFEASKRLDGQKLEDNQFEFELVDPEGNIIGEAFNNDEGRVFFDEVKFDTVGEFAYKIREVEGIQGGITYDKTVYDVTVEVTDDGEGQLTATANYVDGPANFENVYTTEPDGVVIKGTKILAGQDLAAGQFTFELLDSNGEVVDTTTNNADGQIIFDELRFSESDEYYYTVHEVTNSSSQGGVTYDKTVYDVIVEVTDDGEGRLTATANYVDGPVRFTNTYEAEPDSVVIKAEKRLEGQTLGNRQFEFELVNEKGHVLEKVPNNADGQITFSEITYDAVGEHTYTIREVEGAQGGVSYDTNEFTVTVTVTDDDEGQLIATPVYSSKEVVFTNTYETKPDSVVIEAHKILEGKDLVADQFIFELVDTDNNVLQTTTNNRQGQIIFKEIEFDEEGEYLYTIREVEGIQGGITYDSTEFTVSVTVVDDGEGQLGATPVYSSEEVIFKNSYSAAPTKVTLKASKDLNGQVLEADQFNFELVEEGKVIHTATNDIDGAVVFETITYEEVGTYYYQIREVQGEQGGMTYDTEMFNVVVNVTDNGKGQLETDVRYLDGPVIFTNTYVAEPAVIELEAKKELEGQDLKADQFEFELVDSEGTVLQTVENNANGSVTFEEIFYEYEDIGTYGYTIREVEGNQGGVTYDPAVFNVTVNVVDGREGKIIATVEFEDGPAVFNNDYTPAPDALALEASKTLAGQKLNAGQFEFKLIDSEGNVFQTVENNADGSVIFNEITYEEVGTHTYTIREVEGSQGGMTYDPTVFEVIVTITDDGVGQLTATADYINGQAAFTNTYEAKPITVDLNAGKVLEGRHTDLNENEFDFEVVDSEGLVVAKGANDTDGNIAFETIEYVEAGTHEYTIREVIGEDRNIRYDTTEYKVNVIVTDNGVGQLEAEVTYVEEPVFTNEYIPLKVSVGDYVWIDENKDGLQDETDTPLEGIVLVLKDKDGNIITEDVYGNPIEPQVTDENGYYSFDDLYVDNTYIVEIDREASAEALEGLEPTLEEEGDDNSVDSSTWEATSRLLTEDGDRDPTLDFGFKRPSVNVGDYVWFDANKDGLQDDTDVPLEGVVLTVEDENGNAVTDVYGNLVEPTTTDENGYYIFENLPIDHTYTVRIDQEASAEVLKEYVPTHHEVGDDRAIDSSTWEATSRHLTKDGEHDPTLDFGFVKEVIEVSGVKIWEDADNQDGKRPDSITVNLLANGEKVDSVEVTEADGWTYRFTDLTKYAEGQEIRYTISELPVPGYVSTIDGFDITNTIEPVDPEPIDPEKPDTDRDDVEAPASKQGDSEAVSGKADSGKEGQLPNTATNVFNLIVIGLGLLSGGWFIYRRKRATE